MHRLLVLLICAALPLAAESVPVVSVTGPDRVVVKVYGVPIALTLAHLDIPTDDVARRSCQDQLSRLLSGKQITLVHNAEFGSDEVGTGKVHVAVAGADAGQALIEGGYARFAKGGPGNGTYDKLLTMVQERAQKAKKGVWATTAPPASAAMAVPAVKAVPAKGAFASELNSKYFYPSGHRALASVNSQRLICYADEAAAKKAGKVAPPAESASASLAPSEGNADKLFAEGKEIYAQAIAAGNSDRRDDLYGEAFVKLSEAMNIYGPLVEKDENNDVLAEKLRECMQLRYGSVKQRRVH